MNFKKNINTLHHNISSDFELKVIEGYRGNSEDILFLIERGGLTCKVLLNKKNLEQDLFKWEYFPDPIKESFTVERNSSIETFYNDITDIFTNNRFDREYTELVNEGIVLINKY